MAKLRPRARIVRTIGDQLISGPEAALIELVKNAFDADSPAVHISITPESLVKGQSQTGKIVVTDTGHGMSSADILEKWFEPATSDKIDRKLSPGKRQMLGAKGVGRFAAARLGSMLRLRSLKKITNKQTESSEVIVDWRMFDRARYLDEVDIQISSKITSTNDASGVTLEITELRDHWTEKELTQLIRELKRLATPVRNESATFEMFLDLSAFQHVTHGFDGQALVSGAFGNEEGTNATKIQPIAIEKIFHYNVSGAFDSEGNFLGSFINQRGEGKKQKLLISAPKLLVDESSCGSVKLHLNIYDREGEAIQDLFERLGLGTAGRIEARRILDETIGIGIYRNGFRIRPYGDAQTDWLELERMRVQNPSRKLGLNQVWGIVDIKDEAASRLVERSSREGLDHNGAFIRLKRLVAGLLSEVEALRQGFRESAGISRKSAGDTTEIKSKASLRATNRAAADLPDKYRQKMERAIAQDSVALKTSIAELETYQQVLISHSTLGLVVAQVLHDGRRFLSDISTRSKRIVDGAPRLQEKSEFGEHYRKKFCIEAEGIQISASSLNKKFKLLDPIAGRKRGRPKVFSASKIIDRCLDLFNDAIVQNDIVVEWNSSQQIENVIGYEADLMAALLNIIDNAIHWLGISTVNPRLLKIHIAKTRKYIQISTSNSGPTISDSYHSRLFEPGFSLKNEGSGIGLAIAKEAMRSSKGDIVFDAQAKQTTFVIEMMKAESK
jgi:signal transduction histidine kinase